MGMFKFIKKRLILDKKSSKLFDLLLIGFTIGIINFILSASFSNYLFNSFKISLISYTDISLLTALASMLYLYYLDELPALSSWIDDENIKIIIKGILWSILIGLIVASVSLLSNLLLQEISKSEAPPIFVFEVYPPCFLLVSLCYISKHIQSSNQKKDRNLKYSLFFLIIGFAGMLLRLFLLNDVYFGGELVTIFGAFPFIIHLFTYFISPLLVIVGLIRLLFSKNQNRGN